MIKFPWQQSKESTDNDEKVKLKTNNSNSNINKLEVSSESASEELSDEALATMQKTFEYGDLPPNLKEIVDQIKIADLQIQITKNTLSMIKPTRETIYQDLKAKLKDFPIIES